MIGNLHKNGLGRWEIVPDVGDFSHELTSGSTCEVQVGGHWIRTTIEHSHRRGGYYTTTPGVLLYEGQPARVQR